MLLSTAGSRVAANS